MIKKTFLSAVLLLTGIPLLLSCNSNRQDSLDITPENTAGTWRFVKLTNNTGSTKICDHYYYIDLHSSGNYLAEEFDSVMYEYDCGTWNLKGDSLITNSTNIRSIHFPTGVINRLTRDSMFMTVGNAGFARVYTLMREDSATRLDMPLRLLEGRWNVASKVMKDDNGKEIRTNVDNVAFLFHKDTVTLTLPDSKVMKDVYAVDNNNDFTWGLTKGHALHITPNFTILKLEDTVESYYFLTKDIGYTK